MRTLPPPMDFDALRTKAKAQTNLPPVVYGQAISLFGDYIAYFTLPLYILFLTASAADLGLTAAAETVPMLLFGLAAGVFLDRRTNLTRTLVFADAARAVAFIGLAVGAYTGVATTWMVFGTAFIAGTMSVVFDSGLQALLPSVLEEDMLVEANSRLQLARTVAMTVGPATGGVLVAVAGGFGSAFLVNAATFLGSAVFLTSIRMVRPRVAAARVSFRSALGAGLGFLLREPRLRWATLGATLTNLVFAPLEALLVLYVSERVGLFKLWFVDRALAEEASIGLFFALQAAIGSVGIYFAPRVAERMRLGRMYVAGLVMLGGGFALVAALESFVAVIPAGLALAGAGWVNVALSTMRQHLTPQELLGRVIAASRTMAWAGLPIGAAAGGILAEIHGVVPIYLAGSAAVLVVAAGLRVTALWSRPIPETEAAPRRRVEQPRSSELHRPARARRLLERIADVATVSPFDEFGPVEWGLLAVAAAGFGAIPVMMGEAVETLSPVVAAAGAVLAGAGVSAATPAARMPLARSDWPLVAVVGVGWIALPILLVAVAITELPSAHSGMLLGGVPVIAVLVAWWATRRTTAPRLLGFLLGSMGLALIAIPWGGVAWPGAVASAGAMVAVAALWFPAGSLQRNYSAPPVVLWGFVAACVVLAPPAFIVPGGSAFDWSATLAALAVGAVAAGAFTSLAALVGRAGVARGGVALYFVPVISAILGVVLRSETIPPRALLGAGVLLVAVAVIGRAHVPRAPAPAD